MTEPTPSSPPAEDPRPFHPEGIEAPPWHLDRRAVIGCGGGCLVLGGLMVVLLVVLIVRGSSLLGWALELSQEVLRSESPEDWSEADQARLEGAFDAAERALQSNAGTPEQMQRLQVGLMESLTAASQGTLTREQLEVLERALGDLGSSASSVSFGPFEPGVA
ncbi:MAG: hypothetical protein VYE73_10100 [Acidobacteriota bacterium]|nr:hypothetical protein [Acidobacteriota bacterium]